MGYGNAPFIDALTDDRRHISMRGRRYLCPVGYTAPPLTSTCSVVCRSYEKIISGESEIRKRNISMIWSVIFLVIGIMVLVAGLYYFLKEKNAPESRKIYGIVSVAGAVIVVYSAASAWVFRS